jgi:putative ABC transport system ATP-binding protein
MSVLEAKNITFKYPKGKSNVIENFNCAFNKGEITTITGESGRGKTTLLMLLCAMENKYSGEILYNGSDIKGMNKNSYRAKNVGIIFQSYNLLFHANAIDNVRMSLYLSGNADYSAKKADELLSKVGITGDKQKRKCLHLSGGEQQRVAIARAFAGNPDIIIADEPTGNLDQTNQEQVLSLLQNLAQSEDKCIIIATHSFYLSERADRNIVL